MTRALNYAMIDMPQGEVSDLGCERVYACSHPQIRLFTPSNPNHPQNKTRRINMKRVYIVDDQPAFRRQLRQLLTLSGLEVVGEAGDIPKAEAQICALHPDLAVVDVILPGISGLEGVPRLKALLPELRIILVSAYYDQSQVFQKTVEKAGADAFISKYDLDLEVVRNW
jgi:CheY-like chemotaxis protein